MSQQRQQEALQPKKKAHHLNPTDNKTDETGSFFSAGPKTTKKPHVGIHNYSKYKLSTHEIQLLIKGLSFTPTPVLSMQNLHQHLLQQFDKFAKTLRYTATPYGLFPHTPPPTTSCSYTEPTATEVIYKNMKFIPRKTNFSTTRYSCIQALENYIYNTKEEVDKKLSEICTPHRDNLTLNQQKAITKFQRQRTSITIKPADKNLGLVILDTDDYLSQCATILMDTQTYRPTTEYPLADIKKAIERVCAQFGDNIRHINKHLYEFLLPNKNNSHTPKLYGIPKVHKSLHTSLLCDLSLPKPPLPWHHRQNSSTMYYNLWPNRTQTTCITPAV